MPDHVTEDVQVAAAEGETPEAQAPAGSEETPGKEARALLVDLPEDLQGQRSADGGPRRIHAGDVLERQAFVDPLSIDLEKRTLQVAFASDIELDRGYYIEQLVISPKAMDLGRIDAQQCGLLYNHDRNDVRGVVIPRSVSFDNGVARATLRFRKGAEELLRDIAEGSHPLGVSCFYKPWAAQTTKKADGREFVRFTRYEIMEISIAVIPADYERVGVGRSDDLAAGQEGRRPTEPKERSMPPDIQTPANPEPKAPEVNVNQIREEERKNEQARVADILALGETMGKRELAMEHVKKGSSLREFTNAAVEASGTRMTQAQIEERAKIGMSPNQQRQYSISRFIESMITGRREDAAFEWECHDETLKRNAPEKVHGGLVPFDMVVYRDERVARERMMEARRAFGSREIEYGDTATGAALVGTDHLAGSHIEMLRASSVLVANGARVMPGMRGTVHIPRQVAGADFVIVAEGGTLAASDLQWDGLTLNPFTIATKVPVSRRMLVQSNPYVDALINEDIAMGNGLKLDYYGIRGAGTTEPLGLLNAVGIGLVDGGTDGAVMTWPHTVGLESEVSGDNALKGNLRYLAHPTMTGHWKTKSKDAGSGRFIMEGGEVNGYKVAITTQMPTGVTVGGSTDCVPTAFGNISDVIIPMWSGLDLVVDQISRDDGGRIVKSYQDANIGIRHGESFAKMQGARVG